MALPVKPDSTQEGCHPISSNCVIWQGPDIPCIDLNHGDSVSDVVAKLAERLCDISNQLDISLLDLSCFNPLCPTPEDFQDLIQIIINKICALENPPIDPGTTVSDCPDDCIVTIAPCFQETDFLGNLITTLPLRDYVIKIGNELCSLISTITTIQSSITDLDNRVTYIEDNCCGPVKEAVSTVSCLTTLPPNGIPISVHLAFVEQELCNLLDVTGDPADLTNAILQECPGLDSSLQLGNPPSLMDALPGWVKIGDYNTVADAINNIWLTICDLRLAVSTLQADLVACCTATPPCPTPIILIQFSSPNLGFTCTPLGGTWTITSVAANVNGSRTGTNISLTPAGPFVDDSITLNTIVNTSTNALLNNSLYYNVNFLTITLTDGSGNVCTITEVLSGIDGAISCPAATFAADPLNPGEATFSYAGLITGAGVQVQYQLINCNTGSNVGGINNLPAGAIGAVTFTGLTSGEDYKVAFAMIQNGVTKTCGETSCDTIA